MSQDEQVNPSSLTVEQAARLIRQPVATVEAHVAAGLPVDGQGRIHLVEYVAWLITRLERTA